MDSGRAQTLDQELAKLKVNVDKLHDLLGFERLSYNMIESQHERLKMRNAELEKKNAEVEAKIQESIKLADQIVANAKDEEAKMKAQATTLWVKSHAKFKEIENLITAAEKKALNKHLDELEAIKT